MSVEKFSFNLDRDRALLTVVMSDFWDMATVKEYALRVTEQLRELKRLGRPTACLVDVREHSVQPKAVTDYQQKIVVELGPLHADRVAIVASSALLRIQTQRICAQRQHLVFDAIEPALAWLLGERAEVA